MAYMVIERTRGSGFNQLTFTTWESLVQGFLRSNVSIEDVYYEVSEDYVRNPLSHYNSITTKSESRLTEEDCEALFEEYREIIKKALERTGQFADYNGAFSINVLNSYLAIDVYSDKAYTYSDSEVLTVWYDKSKIKVEASQGSETPRYKLEHKDGKGLNEFEFHGQIVISNDEYNKYNGILDAVVFEQKFNEFADTVGFTVHLIELLDD